MKTKKGLDSSNKKCTCSAIQQCEAHRKPREQLSRSGNDIREQENNIKNKKSNKK